MQRRRLAADRGGSPVSVTLPFQPLWLDFEVSAACPRDRAMRRGRPARAPRSTPRPGHRRYQRHAVCFLVRSSFGSRLGAFGRATNGGEALPAVHVGYLVRAVDAVLVFGTTRPPTRSRPRRHRSRRSCRSRSPATACCRPFGVEWPSRLRADTEACQHARQPQLRERIRRDLPCGGLCVAR